MTPDFLDEADEETEEATTRKIEDEPDNLSNHEATNVTESANESVASTLPGFLLDDSNDIMIQKLRIGQMKKLRREIRKLEKLEKIRLEKAISSESKSVPPLTETELLKQIARKSDNSTVTSVCSSISPKASTASRRPQNSNNYHRGIEGQSASGSDSKAKKLPLTTEQPKKVTKKKKPSVASVKEFCTNTHQQQKVMKKPINPGIPNADLEPPKDFGQTFPTPRLDANTMEKQAEKKANRSNKAPASMASKKRSKPVAYYLSVPKESVVKVGTKKAKTDKENSNILANYLSEAVEAEISQRPPNSAKSRKNEDVIKKDNVQTLQEALLQKKPDFIQRSLMRVEILNNIKTQRLIHAEKYRLWLDEMSKAPGRETRIFSQPPLMPKMPRLFTYREMVHQAREKYQKLPEVAYSKAVAKRKSSYQTNRLKADMYKKKLQRKVLQGRVSLNNHNQILDS